MECRAGGCGHGQFPSDATFVRRSASDLITLLVSQLKAAGYVCEQSERHIEPRLKKQRGTVGQLEQSDRDTAGDAARQPERGTNFAKNILTKIR